MKNSDNANLFSYEILIEVSTTSSEAEEEYGAWSSETSFEVLGVIRRDMEKAYGYTTTSTVDFAVNDVAYLLFYSSDSGDSFGSATDSSLEGVHLFKSIDLALMAAQRLLIDYELRNDEKYMLYCKKNVINKNAALKEELYSEYALNYLYDDFRLGKIHKYDYVDYFGGLNQLNIYKVIIEKPQVIEKECSDMVSLVYDIYSIQKLIGFDSKLLTKAINLDSAIECLSEKRILEKSIPINEALNKLIKI